MDEVTISVIADDEKYNNDVRNLKKDDFVIGGDIESSGYHPYDHDCLMRLNNFYRRLKDLMFEHRVFKVDVSLVKGEK